MATRKAKLSAPAQVNRETVKPEAAAVKPSIKDKLKQPKVFVPLIIIALILAAFYLKGLFIVALINGEPISRLTIVQELEKQGGKQALSSLVNQTLILQEAKKKNVQVIQAEIDKAEKKIEDSLKAQGQSLDTALTMQGMTRKDLALQLKLRSLVEKLLADKIKVTEKEIADYIEKNKDTFPTTLTSDQIKTSVEEQLKQQKLASESQTWIEGLKKNAKINYFVNY
jgi:parvulin-like peptidyl-prolyl isomerase